MPPPSASSTFGAVLTPKGNLRVLVIFAGYSEEAVAPDPSQNIPGCWSYNSEPWPNTPIAGSGQLPNRTQPTNLNQFFYTNPAQFSPTATDQTLSNFYYQMSRTTASPFRVTFGFLPGRVNVSYGAFPYLPSATAEALRLSVAQNPNFDWGAYDQRTNQPEYLFDNSTSAPDGKLDYVLVCWRTFKSCGVGQGGDAGYAGPGVLGGVPIPIANGRTRVYSLSEGHVQAGANIGRNLFLHEFAHNLYNAPHQLGANGVTGNHFDSGHGWGMMRSTVPTLYSANAWERWLNGWTELRTGASQVSSDIQDATSLTATSGVYTLRDFVTTGDVIRLRIPNSGQFLWLENRAKSGPCDRRNDLEWSAPGDGLTFPPPPQGLLAMVEGLAGRSTPLSYNDIFTSAKVSQLRTLSAEGNFDYVANGPASPWNQHLWAYQLHDFTPSLNPTGGVGQINNVRLDANNDNVVDYAGGSGNGDLGAGNEATWMVVANSQFKDGMFGPNIGSRTVGFRYGLNANTLLTNNPIYDPVTQQSGDLVLSGLSVQITGYDAVTGDLTLKVRYDDTQLRANTRWTGQLRTYPVANATFGAEISVYNGVRFTLDRGTSPQRSTKTSNGDFVNDTRLTVSAGTRLRVESAGNMDLRGQGTTLYAEQGGSVYIGGGGKITAYPGTTISLQNRADFYGSGELMAGAKLVVRGTNTTLNGPASW